MEYFKDGKIVIDLDEEQGEKVWLITTCIHNDGKKYVAMARDLTGEMYMTEGEELLEDVRYTEDEAEERCIEWGKKLDLPLLNV